MVNIHLHIFRKVLVFDFSLVISDCHDFDYFFCQSIFYEHSLLVAAMVGYDFYHRASICGNWLVLVEGHIGVLGCLFPFFHGPLLLRFIDLHFTFQSWVIHAHQFIKLLPTLYLSCFMVALDSSPLESASARWVAISRYVRGVRGTSSVRNRIWFKYEVWVIDCSTLAFHVVHGCQVAQGAKFLSEIENLVCVGAVVTNFLFAVWALAQVTLLWGLHVRRGLAGLGRLLSSIRCELLGLGFNWLLGSHPLLYK